MTRLEFEEALIPLTPNEQRYQTDPDLSYKMFSDLFDNFNPGRTTRADFIKNVIFMADCSILASSAPSKNYKSPNIAFNRQDRFSNVHVHQHSYIEMNYVFSGSCTAMINQKKVQLSTGDICVMDRQVEHTILPTGTNDIVLNIMVATEYFSNSFVRSLLNGGTVAKFLAGILEQANEHNQYLLFHTTQRPLVKELIENMFIEYLDPGICCEDVLRYNLKLLFIELARCYQGDLERKHKQKSKSYLTEILNYMEIHCTDCTLEDVSKQFNFHPNYLSRMIKTETGSKFQDILSESRMNRVLFLLKNSEMPIYKIASECGYQNQNFFYQQFMKRYGQTPKEYRDSQSAQT